MPSRIHISTDVDSCVGMTFEAGGHENLTFDERKCRNYISEARRLRLGDGDAEALSNYFCRVQSRSSNFFYVLGLDEESRIRNVFWADARCRAAYDYFSDVVTFDTTYLTNSYDMPFAPFVGVNHHGQSILLGCGLLSSEDSETFKWLFKSWLTCMLGRAPKAIITDQCRAMAIAIEEIFLDSHHRLCLWHIMKKLPAKLGGHAQYKLIKKQLKNIVYNSLTIDECDENWMKMIEDFNLENNDWLKSLYEQRNRWIPVYVKDKFWVALKAFKWASTQRRFQHTAETYACMILRLGLVGNIEEMEILLNEMIKEVEALLMLEFGCTHLPDFYYNVMPLLCNINIFEEGIKLLRMKGNIKGDQDLYLYKHLIQCLCNNRQLEIAIEFLQEIKNWGFTPLTVTYTDVVNGFCKFGKLNEAMTFLDREDVVQVEPYNALLKGLCNAGRYQEAAIYHYKMIKPLQNGY
ncbi:hypothetical protein ZIOFF_001428 [Zingiber officinale]|uniref:MULE transposase domain-containing protein n=1 Tax=Zingiber officinale TaxID=94328 RepID=A0A8J5IK25_ZINOF|nr:hypothetical protein ZIOFF_001428 [Zingiber officinale]